MQTNSNGRGGERVGVGGVGGISARSGTVKASDKSGAIKSK